MIYMNALMIFLGEFGMTEMIFVAVIILLLFGGRKIPELMKGLGSGIKEFKNAAKDDKNPVSTDPIKPSDPTTPPPGPTPRNEDNA
jgi:sec-independent protein translocase protein TatA